MKTLYALKNKLTGRYLGVQSSIGYLGGQPKIICEFVESNFPWVTWCRESAELTASSEPKVLSSSDVFPVNRFVGYIEIVELSE